jgi:hypothetical protein
MIEINVCGTCSTRLLSSIHGASLYLAQLKTVSRIGSLACPKGVPPPQRPTRCSHHEHKSVKRCRIMSMTPLDTSPENAGLGWHWGRSRDMARHKKHHPKWHPDDQRTSAAKQSSSVFVMAICQL